MTQLLLFLFLQHVKCVCVGFFFQEKLDVCRPLILKELNVSEEFIGHLFQDDIFTNDQRDHILSIERARRRRQEFLDTLAKAKYKRKSPFTRFLQILKVTGQENLRQNLENEKNYADYKKTQKEDRDTVELELKVQKCFVNLTQNLNLESTSLLELFIQEGIMNDDDVSILKYLPATEKARRFLSILERRKHKDKSPYPYFLQALVETGQDFLKKAIEEEEITEEDFNEHESKNLFNCVFIAVTYVTI